MSSLGNFVKRLRDIMRNDAGINGDAQRIEQIAWLLFLKVYDIICIRLEWRWFWTAEQSCCRNSQYKFSAQINYGNILKFSCTFGIFRAGFSEGF
jgi:hypothetical protein